MEFGPGVRPEIEVEVMVSECLIKVFASKDIGAGTELLCTYGPSFWNGDVP
jgi:SET domain-containing protein